MATIARQYKSPHWHLELTGTESPLSRWFGQTLLQDSRFALRQIDPAGLISWQWRGEQDQLEQLQREFADRVQQLLGRSSLTPLNHDWPTIPGLDMPPKLSTIQLLDLVEVLDQWAADTVTLPEDLAPSRRFSLPIVPVWGRVAASSVAAVGLTAGLFHLLGMGGNLLMPQVANRPDPTPGGPVIAQGDQPAPPLTFPGAMTNGQPSPTPGIALFPPVPGSLPGVPPPIAQPTPTPFPANEALPPPAVVTSSQPLIIPPPLRTARAPIVIPPKPIAQSRDGAPEVASAPAAEADQTFARDSAAANAAANAESDQAKAGAAGSSARPEATEARPLPPAAAPAPAELPPAEYKVAEPLPSTPQVAEVQAYLKQRWLPQKTMAYPAQYRLTIAKDGTIAATEPLSSLSASLRDRSGVPLQGAPFVSPLDNETEQTIVVTLRSNGTVEAVLEQLK